MTEVSSQLCTATNQDGLYQPLSIHDIKSDEMNSLYVKSQSFFSYILTKKQDWTLTSIDELLDTQGFLKLPDRVIVQPQGIRVLGRGDGLIKSSGHLVNILDLRELLESFTLKNGCWGEMELQSINSERMGQQIVLYCQNTIENDQIDQFLKLIAPIKISEVKKEKILSRTKLGKFKPS
jgi:hypothetical protein